jgi:SdpI/YfhL protein family
MNAWYGIRTPQTMESENIWYDVNAIMGRFLFSFGIFISGLTLYFALYPLKEEYEMVYILLGTLMLGTVLFVKISYKISKELSSKNYNKH